MPIVSGGYIVVDGREIAVGSPEFAELMPITNAMIMEVQLDDDIASVTTAFGMVVMKMEVELRNLRERLEALEEGGEGSIS